MMNKLFILVSCLLWSFIGASQNLEITNPSDFERTEIVSIPFLDFKRNFRVDTAFFIQDRNTDYDYQFERLGTGRIQNVLILATIQPKSKLTLTVTKGVKTFTLNKTYARHVPERFDDFAWENDVVAFRMYGKSLEGRADDAQGMDYWAKRTNKLIIDKWYKSEDYHADHGEGLDYYSVGQTLGAGDMALYVDNQVHFTKHYRSYEILDNGPIRTTFRLKYDPEIVNGQEISLTKTITLNAGQNFNQIQVDLNNPTNKKNPTAIAIGLAKRDEANQKVKFNSSNTSLVYWEPNIKDFGETGTALIVPQRDKNLKYVENDSKQHLLVSSIRNNIPFIYFNGAVWNKAGKVTTLEQWEQAVNQYVEQIKVPLIIKFK